MILQWCCKGVSGIGPSEARGILTDGPGLICRLWQANNPLPYGLAMEQLSEHHLDLHVNHYDDLDPETGTRTRDVTAFISLSAGCVDRDIMLKTNVVNPARRTALEFATDLGRRDGWLFTCYVLVSVNRAASSPAVAEEVRDLNHLRRYSEYWLEGEIAAKVNVPSRQILAAEHWEPASGGIRRSGGYVNKGFVHPQALLDIREML
jgi:hypothetical protein